MSKHLSDKDDKSEKVRSLEVEIKKLYGVIEASTAVISNLDLDQLLSQIMHIAKKVIGSEASSLMLIDENSGNLVYEVALGEKCDTIKNNFFLEKGKGIAGWVAETGKPLLVVDVKKEEKFFPGVDQATGFKTRSILCVPMKVHNKIIGVLEAMNPTDHDAFDQSDIEIFSAFSSLAAIAIANARLAREMVEKKAIERELSIAKDIQQKFLTSHFPKGQRFNSFVETRSAREIGGDFFNFFQSPSGRIDISVGDVCGRGIPAALYMIEVLNKLRNEQANTQCAQEMIKKMNEHLVEKTTLGSFVTMVYVQFEPNEGMLKIINAGHLPLLIADLNHKKIRKVSGKTTLPLGIQKSISALSENAQIMPGEYLFLFTDGLIEIQNSEDVPFGYEHLEKSLLKYDHGSSPETIVRGVFSDLEQFCAGSVDQDDVTLLALQYR